MKPSDYQNAPLSNWFIQSAVLLKSQLYEGNEQQITASYGARASMTHPFNLI
jgi:hypothetical protein